MKIFIIGMPESGRTTVAKSIVEARGFHYIDAMSWVRSDFRQPLVGEHPHQYEDEYQLFLSKRMLNNPTFIVDHVNEMIEMYSEDGNQDFVIDGVASPQDFMSLFDYRKDVVVFLKRIDNDHEYRDHENIGNSVIRDYCFWMSAAGVIDKKNWLEYNFRIPGEDVDNIKAMGAQNSVFIVKSIKRVMSHVNNYLTEILALR